MAKCVGIANEHCNNLAVEGDHCHACGAVVAAESVHDARYEASLQSSYRMIAQHIRERARIQRREDPRDVPHDHVPSPLDDAGEPIVEEPTPQKEPPPGLGRNLVWHATNRRTLAELALGSVGDSKAVEEFRTAGLVDDENHLTLDGTAWAAYFGYSAPLAESTDSTEEGA